MYVYILLALALFSGLIYSYTRKPVVSPAPQVEEVIEEIAPVSTPAPEPVLANPQTPEYTPSPATNPEPSYTLEQVPVTSILSSYEAFINQDFFGNDITGYSGKSLETCLEECSKLENCKAITFDKTTSGPRCWLKSKATFPTRQRTDRDCYLKL